MPLSAQDVCFCASASGCEGGQLSQAWFYIQTQGVVTGAQQTGAVANDDPFGSAGFCSRYAAALPWCAVRMCASQEAALAVGTRFHAARCRTALNGPGTLLNGTERH